MSHFTQPLQGAWSPPDDLVGAFRIGRQVYELRDTGTAFRRRYLEYVDGRPTQLFSTNDEWRDHLREVVGPEPKKKPTKIRRRPRPW